MRKKIFLCLLLVAVFAFTGCRTIETGIAPTPAEQLVSKNLNVQNAEIITEQKVKIEEGVIIFRIFDKRMVLYATYLIQTIVLSQEVSFV